MTDSIAGSDTQAPETPFGRKDRLTSEYSLAKIERHRTNLSVEYALNSARTYKIGSEDWDINIEWASKALALAIEANNEVRRIGNELAEFNLYESGPF